MFSVMYDFEMQPHRSLSEIDYDISVSDRKNVRSLKELSSNVVITRGVLRLLNCHDLPQQLKDYLLHFAILCRCESSTAALLNAWRRESFQFEPPAPHGTWEMFAVDRSFPRRHSDLSSFMNFLINHFVTLLLSDCGGKSKIRCLDLSAFPLNAHCLKQFCRRMKTYGLSARSSLFSHSASAAKRQRCTADAQSFPNKAVIKINCIIHDDNEISMLIEALCAVKDSNIPLDIYFTGIHINDKSVPHKFVFELIGLIETEALNAFSWSLSYHNFYPPDEYFIYGTVHKLRSFTNLKALNFQLNEWSLGNNSRFIVKLGEIVSRLGKLKHFYMSEELFMIRHVTNPLNLEELNISSKLPSMTGSLECLVLVTCNVSPECLESLSSSHHVCTLRTLSISHCSLDLKGFTSLLAVCVNLCVLDLEENKYSGEDIDLLFTTLSTMQKLKCLKMVLMDMSREAVLSKAVFISRMPSLESLSLTPNVLGPPDNTDTFEMKFQRALKGLWNCPSRSVVMF